MCCEYRVPTGSHGHGPSGRGHHHSRGFHCCGIQGEKPFGAPICKPSPPGQGFPLWRRFRSSEERKEALKRYIGQLEQELKGAKEMLEEL